MKFRPSTRLQGVVIIDLEPHRDERGFFARSFCERAFADQGLETSFPQHSISSSQSKGTVRGMHFRMPPRAEAKLVRCTRGAIFDVLVDVRPTSQTFGQWEGFELTADGRTQLYVPEGFAHGFQTLCDDVEATYLISEFHGPEGNTGLRLDDPEVGIVWPLDVSVIAPKDLAWPSLSSLRTQLTGC